VAETSEQFAKFQAGEVARNAALLKSVDFRAELTASFKLPGRRTT
jgi:hypothetical protein